ncbi:MAG TPA: hypothetical protein VHO70_08605, partial [Chitinispirillaceae bacterium]|nr:hypothetical protein [Chitinispirillaceae bacterium]
NVLCFHDVAKGNTLVEKKASLDSAMILFEYIHSRENEIWVENFTKVAKYAQQRDSHTLNVIDKDSQFIRLSLTDSLIDSIFSYPLTIKVPLSDSWNSICIAFQNGKIIPLSFVYHGGAYVLIQAIPDRGDIFLYKNPADSASFFKTSKSESRYRSGKKTVRMADTEKKASDNMINLMGKSVSPVKNKKSLRFLLTR